VTPSVEIDEHQKRLRLGGDWQQPSLPDPSAVLPLLENQAGNWQADVTDISAWDSRLHALLLRLHRILARRGDKLELTGAPETQQRLFHLATAVAPPTQAPKETPPLLSIPALREGLTQVGESFLDSLAFLGSAIQALFRVVTGRSSMRLRELVSSCYQSGPDALPIIVLTSVLVGMILAYLGAAQLQQFGAAVYVADLVAVGMLREMGALMTAVVMAGRTGAAYAAQLSTMQGNEEIDAIQTLGIDPMEFLVAPRIIALVCMMPLLVIFADALGILGGALVAGGMGVTPLQYISQLESVMTVTHFLVGLTKAFVFAMLIAVAGCRAGIKAGRSSAAVGQATTDAVVTSVVYLIIADAAINILCEQMSI